jgi:pimeloyl-ACP methyl ester carboxylesterase
MPIIAVNGTKLYYEDTGPGSTGETIVFSHGLLWSTALFGPQALALRDRYRCIRYDHRGQGLSAESDLNSIGMDLLTDDAIALLKELDTGPVHFCGVSMGGFVGMRLAARRPELVKSLILVETTADPEPAENVSRYRRLNFVGRYLGFRLVANKVMTIMFGKTFLTDPERAPERSWWRSRLIYNRRTMWRAVNGVIEREGVYDELKNIKAPVLILSGDEDVATVPAKMERIHAAIPGSKLVVVKRAGHSSTVEQPEQVNRAIEEFLSATSGS